MPATRWPRRSRPHRTTATNYYVLGFYLAETDLDGSGHQVTLEVSRKAAHRPDLALHYRQVYLASKTGPGDEKKPTVADLFRDAVDATAIGLTAAIVPDPAKPGARQVQATVSLADIELRREQDRWVGSFQVAMRLESMQSAALMATPPVERTVTSELHRRGTGRQARLRLATFSAPARRFKAGLGAHRGAGWDQRRSGIGAGADRGGGALTVEGQVFRINRKILRQTLQ